VGAAGAVVRRAQRALRRTPDLGLLVDGVFGAQTLAAVTQFQSGSGLSADGIVGPLTWAALPGGGPMPVLAEGSSGAAVTSLQAVLASGASKWGASPGPADGERDVSRSSPSCRCTGCPPRSGQPFRA
jgi:peptidoglycan hydrolase-like protein with peptidoglycan-binding domain